MNQIRRTFLQTSEVAGNLLSRDEVGKAWSRESALRDFSIAGLAGHLVRATTSVEAYLDRGDPGGEPGSPAHYYAAAVDSEDLSSPLHVAIRARGEEAAKEGHAALVKSFGEARARLAARLADEPPDRRVRVFKDFVLLLDDYLITRLVELVVHIDDLAISVRIDAPEVPEEAFDLAIVNMVDIARARHGDLAVVRALARRERDEPAALRVF